MSRNTKKKNHNKLKSGKEIMHSQTKKIRNKYLGGLSVVPQKNIGNCEAHALTRSIYRLFKMHKINLPGTEIPIPESEKNSRYYYEFLLIQLVLKKTTTTKLFGKQSNSRNILDILNDKYNKNENNKNENNKNENNKPGKKWWSWGGNKTKESIHTIQTKNDDIDKLILEKTNTLSEFKDVTVDNIESVKQLADEINSLCIEKNDNIQKLNNIIYEDKIKSLQEQKEGSKKKQQNTQKKRRQNTKKKRQTTTQKNTQTTTQKNTQTTTQQNTQKKSNNKKMKKKY